MSSAGRFCPIDYHIAADAFIGKVDQYCDNLYVVGGLYGNSYAFDALDELIACEQGQTTVVLNGDIHWFDYPAEDFLAIEDRLSAHLPLVGNVELELRRQEDIGAGCGCAYPAYVSDGVVERSNSIHRTLSETVFNNPSLKERLLSRAATAVCVLGDEMSGVKVAITHGDEKLVGGWDCSREALANVVRQKELSDWMQQNEVAILATTHTCAPAMIQLEHGVVINNGAAGMPNFESLLCGLVTRISKQPNADALYHIEKDGVYIEAVPLRYNHEAFLAWFDDIWPTDSPAAISYRERIKSGPYDYLVDAKLNRLS